MIRFSSLGDILLTAPALRVLRTRFPESQIDFLVSAEYANAARLLKGFDLVIAFDKKRGFRGLCSLCSELTRRYTILVDLQNTPRSVFLRYFTFPNRWVKAKRHRLRRWLLIHLKWNLYRQPRSVSQRYLDAVKTLGTADDGRGLELSVPSQEREWAEKYFAKDSRSPFIALCPGARHFTKRWPVERWIELGQRFRSEGFRVMVVGAPEERDLLNAICVQIEKSDCVWDRTVREVAALLECAAAVVSNDSGLMHLATGVGTPLVAIFGPTVEEFGFYPFRSVSEVMEHTLRCRPCSAMGGSHCPKLHFRCMLDTSPEAVVTAVQRRIKTVKD